ncbi:transglycosylase SLT domain-containing protein [Halorhodospira neutriphila]|uniref:Transglycosylase SLT domain-containing protein n=1 Tax=Halorhodospira neutriphila TaxID=168379 RepID=A0ABS1E3C4_9GAMM|nr:transglycosylase SLT domain-containing protein [Halorhodospira neutriphila]MBK1726255.1 hypothetical protein [Halorhodospira neutriphila]
MERRSIFFSLAIAVCTLPSLPSTAQGAEGFQEYREQHKQEFENYREEVRKSFQAYQEAFQEEFQAYKDELSASWEDPQLSNQKQWVRYSEDQKSRTIVDYEENNIKIDVPEEEGVEGALEKLDKLLEITVDEAYEDDEVTQRAQERTDLGASGIDAGDQRVLSELSREEVQKMVERATAEKRSEPAGGSREPTSDDSGHNGGGGKPQVANGSDGESSSKAERDAAEQAEGKGERKVISVSIPMPDEQPAKKAEEYRDEVTKIAKKYNVEPALILAIIHSESSFNPMARSPIPAYGLMQIVPETAGLDVAQYLHGEARKFSPQYLYNVQNNIQAGAVYLNILETRYVSEIENPESRLYAKIAAYNIGSGYVAYPFTGEKRLSDKAVEIINSKDPEEVYEALHEDLPAQETRDYLSKVSRRLKIYREFF